MLSARRITATLLAAVAVTVGFSGSATAATSSASEIGGTPSDNTMHVADMSGDVITVTERAEVPAWSVQWPAATVALGEPAQALVTLQPSDQAYDYSLQRLIDGEWATVVTYSYVAHPSEVRFPIPLDTTKAGWTDYRVRQGRISPEVASSTFRHSVTEPVQVENPNAAPTEVSVSTLDKKDRKVVAGEKVTMHGTVTGGSRDLVVEFRTDTGWYALKTFTSDTTGRFATRIPTKWYGNHRVRVTAPSTEAYRAGSSVEQRLVVKPDYKPRGPKSKWRLISKARWNPCTTINVKTNLQGAPAGSGKNVKRAFRLIAAATGLRFNFAGRTNKVPWAKGSDGFEDGAIIIAWTTPARVPDLHGSVLGVGGAGSTYQMRNGERVAEYYYGGVALDSTDNKHLRNGFGPGMTQGALLLHEIAHVIGLHHVNAPSQLMNPFIRRDTLAKFGAGDLAGLRNLGAAKGCL